MNPWISSSSTEAKAIAGHSERDSGLSQAQGCSVPAPHGFPEVTAFGLSYWSLLEPGSPTPNTEKWSS